MRTPAMDPSAPSPQGAPSDHSPDSPLDPPSGSPAATPAALPTDRQSLPEELLRAGQDLRPPDAQALNALASQAETLAQELTRKLLAREDLEEALVGHGNVRMMADNHLNHFRYMASSLGNGDPAELAATVLWVLETYLAHGFRPEYWRVMLPLCMQTLSQGLPQHAQALLPWYRYTLRCVEVLLPQAQAANSPGHERREECLRGLSPLARRYVDLLLCGDRRGAASAILGQLQAGLAVRPVYLEVFQPALRAVGQLWQRGLISVAVEHYITAATQMVMSQIFPLILGAPRNGVTFVGCCVATELHEVGMRMVTDLLELDGYDTWYLGANTPDEGVVDMVAEKRAQVLGVSATMAQGVPLVQRLIAALRRDERTRGVAVLVGGMAFAHNPSRWRDIGADGYAADAGSVETLVRSVLAGQAAA